MRKRIYQHRLRGSAVKLKSMDQCGQALYQFISGDWKGMKVRCEPRNFTTTDALHDPR